MQTSPPDAPSVRLPGLGSGAALFLTGFVAGLAPRPVMPVGPWAKEYRYVSAESGSPFPGKWDPGLTPYMAEPEECVSFTHPARDIAIAKSAQVAATELGVNVFGSIAHKNPSPLLIVLPTVDEAKKYNKVKLQPTIEATPVLRKVVLEQKSRDEDSSTAMFKRFRGGFAVITGANSSSGLQMLSAKTIIFEEVAEYPDDAGGRGDPVEQALARNKAWTNRGPKRLYSSTPGIKGACRITTLYEQSDQRRYYVPCPHCGAFQVLRWAPDRKIGTIAWTGTARPYNAHYVCEACGCDIAPYHKRAMVAAGVWIKTYPGPDENPAPPSTIDPADIPRWRARTSAGRFPGFHIWQAYSPFVEWEDTVDEYIKAKDSPRKLKAFHQQGLGLAWEERGDAPPAERLVDTRESFPPRRVPLGALFITVFVDVQKDRLEYGVYAWGAIKVPGDAPEGWLIDHDVIVGNPEGPEVWRALDEVLGRTYEDPWGKAWDIDAIGLDTGYLSNRVYAYCLRHAMPRPAKEPHNPESTRHVFACDGRAGWKLPPLFLAKPAIDVDFEGRKIGAVPLWGIGTWDMKAEHYYALRQTLAGADPNGRAREGTLHFNQTVTREFFEQLTAEHLQDEVKNGVPTKRWVCPKGKRNEALDIAVGARALAHHLAARMTPADWQALAARRYGPAAGPQGDLAALWAPGLAAPRRDPEPANAVRQDAPAAAAAPRVVDRSASGVQVRGRTITRH